INSLSNTMTATQTGAAIRLTYAGSSAIGHNGNRLGAHGFVSGARTETWTPQGQPFTGGISPSKWRITLPFANLYDINAVQVPTSNIRKMRWTYAADWQSGEFARSEFAVSVTNWTVSGTGRAYNVASPGSRRVEDRAGGNTWSGAWQTALGNFSDGTIHYTTTPASSVVFTYQCGQNHSLYLGTRYTFNGTTVGIRVDSGTEQTKNLYIAGEDVLARVLVGQFNAGTHAVEVRHLGNSGEYLYVDFVEAAVPATSIPAPPVRSRITLATDWDTDHS